MAQIIRPRTLNTALTDGEQALLNFLEHELSADWTIYVQPFLNGDNPDFVALNPLVGIIVFEVKDYAENLYSVTEHGLWKVRNASGLQTIGSPLKQVESYRNNIVGLYCPEIGEEIDSNKNHLAVIRLVLYFHNMRGKEARKLCASAHSNLIVLGSDELSSGTLQERAREIRDGSKLMRQQWAKSLSSWLQPPQHLETHGRLQLTTEQKKYTQPKTGLHRLRGVAGSGKSLVLAHRAVERASRGEKVLVLTFNITLSNYVRDLMKRAGNFPHDAVIVTHFHGFCRLVLDKMNLPRPTFTKEDNYCNDVLPNSVIEAATNNGIPEELYFDGIYIDEGQDFRRNWVEACLCFRRNNALSEVFLVVDFAQNLYDRDTTWSNNTSGLGFKGRWAVLKQSHRLPQRIREVAWEFAVANNLKTAELLPPEYNKTTLFEPILIWHNEDNIDEACRITLRLYRHFHEEMMVQPQDIAVLVPSRVIGNAMVDYLRSKGERPNHVFSDTNGNHRANKLAFWMGSRGVKISTVHSFKGWECRFVIALLSDAIYSGVVAERLFYVALTRCREGVCIINSTSRLAKGEASWDKLPETSGDLFTDFKVPEKVESMWPNFDEDPFSLGDIFF